MKKIRVKIDYEIGSKVVHAYAFIRGIGGAEGKAKCSPEDKFDLNFGADLATKRAKLNLALELQKMEKEKWERLQKESEKCVDNFLELEGIIRAYKKELKDKGHHE